jgi:mannosyltransferase
MDERPPIRSYVRGFCLIFAYSNLSASGEPPEPLRRVEGDNYEPNNPNSARINATLLALVRNEELEDMLQSMRDLERTWNHKFNYPWTFFNDKEFTEEFKKRTRAVTKAETRYGRTSLSASHQTSI